MEGETSDKKLLFKSEMELWNKVENINNIFDKEKSLVKRAQVKPLISNNKKGLINTLNDNNLLTQLCYPNSIEAQQQRQEICDEALAMPKQLYEMMLTSNNKIYTNEMREKLASYIQNVEKVMSILNAGFGSDEADSSNTNLYEGRETLFNLTELVKEPFHKTTLKPNFKKHTNNKQSDFVTCTTTTTSEVEEKEINSEIVKCAEEMPSYYEEYKYKKKDNLFHTSLTKKVKNDVKRIIVNKEQSFNELSKKYRQALEKVEEDQKSIKQHQTMNRQLINKLKVSEETIEELKTNIEYYKSYILKERNEYRNKFIQIVEMLTPILEDNEIFNAIEKNKILEETLKNTQKDLEESKVKVLQLEQNKLECQKNIKEILDQFNEKQISSLEAMQVCCTTIPRIPGRFRDPIYKAFHCLIENVYKNSSNIMMQAMYSGEMTEMEKYNEENGMQNISQEIRSLHKVQKIYTMDTYLFKAMVNTESELFVVKKEYDLLKKEHEELRKICLAQEKENLELKKK